MPDLVVTVSEFVALFNQTLEFAYPKITITGELANFHISKNKWLYFDLKDELSSVKFFGTVYQLPGPLEDGMLLEVRGQPQLHPQYGFSITVQSIKPLGEGSLKRAAALLEAKLKLEGLFDAGRKRPLPYPPTRIGLITSSEAAAYSDFVKVLTNRWGGLVIDFIDTQVQGEQAVPQIVQAIETLNNQAVPPEVLIITRGGGSTEDLQAFNTEQITRAIAGSRVATLVAIGHERDISLAELAADCRASTPSNAAELLVPDRVHELRELRTKHQQLRKQLVSLVDNGLQLLTTRRHTINSAVEHAILQAKQNVRLHRQLLNAFSPQAALERGYAVLRKQGKLIKSGHGLHIGDIVDVRLQDAEISAAVKQINLLVKRTEV